MTHQRKAAPTRRRVLAGATAAGALAFAPAVVRAQAKSPKIAVLLPRSGYFAPDGQSCHRGALIAPKVLADYGYQVDLVHVDVESNPDIARNQCERVINDGVDAVVGAFDSACDVSGERPAQPLLTQSRIDKQWRPFSGIGDCIGLKHRDLMQSWTAPARAA